MLVTLVWACGGTTSGSPDSAVTNDDGGADEASTTDMDSGVEIDTGVPYPAPHPNPPQVVNSGGPVASMGVVVPVFWSNDPLQAQTEQFLQQVSPSTYWTATTKEYGAGDFKLATSIVLTDPPPTNIDDSGIQNWLAAHADGSDMAWPKADPNTVFALFYPSSTTISLQGSQSCSSFGAYHSNANLMDNTAFSYAVMPRCQGGIDTLTASTSHELVEWATDPFPMSTAAYQMVDFNHIYWALAGGEVTDMCEFASNGYARILGNFIVSRSWSNASIKAGHDPCVPVAAGAFFNAAPVLTDTVKFSFYGQPVNTKGVKIPVGQSKTIDVDLYSDGPTPPWTVSATTSYGAQGSLSFSFDQNKGINGDVLHLTITALKATSSGTARFTLTSVNAQNVRHTWLGLVGF